MLKSHQYFIVMFYFFFWGGGGGLYKLQCIFKLLMYLFILWLDVICNGFSDCFQCTYILQSMYCISDPPTACIHMCVLSS